jgi:MYXO-CTERM domain-containing protein
VDSNSHSVSGTVYGAAAPIGLVWLVALAVVFVLRRTMTDP